MSGLSSGLFGGRDAESARSLDAVPAYGRPVAFAPGSVRRCWLPQPSSASSTIPGARRAGPNPERQRRAGLTVSGLPDKEIPARPSARGVGGEGSSLSLLTLTTAITVTHHSNYCHSPLQLLTLTTATNDSRNLSRSERPALVETGAQPILVRRPLAATRFHPRRVKRRLFLRVPFFLENVSSHATASAIRGCAASARLNRAV